jgi:hypothetical protein
MPEIDAYMIAVIGKYIKQYGFIPGVKKLREKYGNEVADWATEHFDTLLQGGGEGVSTRRFIPVYGETQIKLQKGLSKFITDPNRITSREIDFGAWWNLEGYPKRHFSVSWVESTGDLYVWDKSNDEYAVVLTLTPREEQEVREVMSGFFAAIDNGIPLEKFLSPKQLGKVEHVREQASYHTGEYAYKNPTPPCGGCGKFTAKQVSDHEEDEREKSLERKARLKGEFAELYAQSQAAEEAEPDYEDTTEQ